MRAFPDLEEACRFPELGFPLLPLAPITGREPTEIRNEESFGEMIANNVPPPSAPVRSRDESAALRIA